MRTQTIERTDTDERVDDGTDSDTPKYFHYVKKDKIAESAVMGTHVVALCGEVFPVTQGRQARLAGVPGLQADLRETQEVAPSALAVAARGALRAPAAAVAVRVTRPSPPATTGIASRGWPAPATPLGSAAFSSAPIMIAKPRKKANNKNAIGVASAPYV